MRFRNRQHAEQAKEAMEGCVLGKRPIRVGWGEASTQRNCVHVQAMTLGVGVGVGVGVGFRVRV